MRAKEIITEIPLPPSWDKESMSDKTSFKLRLKYALDRAERIGTGSSRVAFIIPYEGRNTVLKVAKNRKGLAQNEAEVDVLEDRYIQQLQITIPLIDYYNGDKVTWVHTEYAEPATEKQLCDMMKCVSLNMMSKYAQYLGNPSGLNSEHIRSTLDNIIKIHGKKFTEDEVEIFHEYSNKLAILILYSLDYSDFDNPKNWGIYQGRPVLVDLGYTEYVRSNFY